MVKDVAKSIKNRLLEQTRKSNGNYQQVLIRFFHERLIMERILQKPICTVFCNSTRLFLRFSTHRVENRHSRYLHGVIIGAFCVFLMLMLVNGIYRRL